MHAEAGVAQLPQPDAGEAAVRPGPAPRLRPADEDFLEASRTRVATPLVGRDRSTSFLMGSVFLIAAGAMAWLLPWQEPLSLSVLVVLVLGCAVASRVEFAVGTGSAVPTQLVFVPMLFALPTPLAPLCAAAGFLLGALPDVLAGTVHAQRLFVLLSSSWYAIGPALVLSLSLEGAPRWSDWPIFLAALAAQFGLDLASSTAREWFAFGHSPRLLLPFFAWVYAVDSLLAPVGLLAAFATQEMEFAFLLALPLIGLLALHAHERQARIDRALAFNEAYRSASEEARRDALTGVGNRLAWEEALTVTEARRQSSPAFASVLVLDLDDLKVANDTRGHAFGDRLIAEVAALVRANVRRGDLVARVGGDELAVLMLDAGEAQCRETGARIAGALARHSGVEGFRLSASLGFASSPPAATLEEAQRRADADMYERKRRTRWADDMSARESVR